MRAAAWILLWAGLQACGSPWPEPEAPASGDAPPPAAAREPDPGPPSADPDDLARATHSGLRVLRARAVEESLARLSGVAVPPGPRTLGVAIPVTFQVHNGLGADLEVHAPESGLWLELEWTVERWSAYGSRDRQVLRRVARLESGFLLAAGETFRQSTSFPLEAEGDNSALWSVSLAGRMHPAGVTLGDQDLPVQEIALQPAEFLVLPPGWGDLAKAPLDSLRRAVGLDAAAADRHVVVAAALLPAREKEAGLALLMQALARPLPENRLATVTTALAWLSGEDLGLSPVAWNQWWEGRRMSRATDGS